MLAKVYVVTCKIEESVYDDSWTNFNIIGCFFSELEAQNFAKEYEKQVKKKHENKIGWSDPECDVYETELHQK